MRRILLDGAIVDDPWHWALPDGAPPVAGTRSILSLDAWRAAGRPTAGTGVWLAPDDDPAALLPELPTLPVVAIHFPVFTDGRGYSIARLLRQRLHYTGEIRAVGDVLRDQVHPLHRSGFNAFQLRDDQSLQDARKALLEYTWIPFGERFTGGPGQG